MPDVTNTLNQSNSSNTIGDDPEVASAVGDAHFAAQAENDPEAAIVTAQNYFGFGCPDPSEAQGYIDNAELLRWVAEHNADLNVQLRDLMNAADARTKMVEDLTKVKGVVGEKLSMPAALATAEAMKQEWADTPYADEVNATIDPVIDDLKSRIADHPDEDLPAEIVSKIEEGIQAKIDQLNKQDQTDMLYIQDLTSRIRQNVELVSNMISITNQTSMNLIGNIGRA